MFCSSVNRKVKEPSIKNLSVESNLFVSSPRNMPLKVVFSPKSDTLQLTLDGCLAIQQERTVLFLTWMIAVLATVKMELVVQLEELVVVG